MTLQEKYAALITAAKTSEVTNLQVREQEGVLYLEGSVNSGAVKDNLWNIYNTIDPDFSSSDLILNVNVTASSGSKAKVITEHSNLNVRKGPGTEQPLLGKAEHGEDVTVLNQTNQQWWLIKTAEGIEGYAYAQYLSPTT